LIELEGKFRCWLYNVREALEHNLKEEVSIRAIKFV
jgi:hypothetical protein